MANEQDKLKEFLALTNLCDEIDDQELSRMGEKIVEWFDEDESSREDWKKRTESWLKLATQVVERKTYPWPDSANVKFPLLTTAAMQFAARAYPALVPGPSLVTGLVVGKDDDGAKAAAAERVGKHMSYQLLWEMQGWEEDMDRLCLMLPVVGCVFKKTYYDPIKKRNCSELVLAQDFVIDYYAKTVETANRKSHIIYKNENEVEERVRHEVWRDCDLGTPKVADKVKSDAHNKIDGLKEPKVTPATPFKFIECHCFWDLDEDDYEEPYIVTVHYDTKQVVRVTARFAPEGIKTTKKGDIASIEPTEYFTKFGFIPNPDGSIYDLGFGILLGGINETVNTLTNQLLDSGTLNNLQAGFLGKGIRVRGGNTRFIPGEWKPADFTGDDIKKHIFSLPTKEPSDVLFKLLETLVTSGKELASVAEIFVGKMPGQNTPATTTMATIEQGMKVFTAIYKRIYRALGQEYMKLYNLNKIHMEDTAKVYFTLNEPQGANQQSIEKQDYSDSISIKPNADPNIVSSAQKLMKVQAMGALLQLGTLNPQVYTKRYLEAIEADGIQELMTVPPPQPSPEQQQMQAEMALKKQDSDAKMALMQAKAAADAKDADLQMRIKIMEAQLKQQGEMIKLQAESQKAQLDLKVAAAQHEQTVVHNQQTHEQDMQHQKEAGAAKVEAMKAQAAAKPKPSTSGGK
jgi:chaperonin GroES